MKAPIAGVLAGSLLAGGLAHPEEQLSDERAVRSLIELRRNGVVMQEWDLSCGAAALTTLLNQQFSDPLSEREVATALMNRPEYLRNPDLVRLRQGFSLLDLKRFVESRGYRGVGLGRLELEDLDARAPLLVPIESHGYNHFVIYRGSLGNRVLLADPAWGNRTLLKAHFESMWIDFPEIGRVGFQVLSASGERPPNRFAPDPRDFVMLR
ncbi:MAG: C39 family peptidase [Chromatiaceae bacterium]|nr:C39 family peptidase [Chromatiaceae bacterium]